MTEREYSWRFMKGTADGLIRDTRRNELLERLSATEPHAVYCACLEFALRNGSQKATGYAAHLFREIFGDWPQPRERGAPKPLPNFLIDQYAALRSKKPKNGAANGQRR